MDLAGHEQVLGETTVSPGLIATITGTVSGLRLQLQGAAGARIVIETAGDLRGPWSALEVVTMDGGGVGALASPIQPIDQARFYRARQE
jgi:hypothetical protein